MYEQVGARDFDRFIRKSDVVVSHAGVGTLLNLLEMGVWPVLGIRRHRRGEHVDDHQEQIAALANSAGVAYSVEAPELTAGDLREAALWRVTTS
ncbi:glycosyltransferase [Nesterenkonia ebinurensis]|uniref:glycosyltransferase n=1 Tax=Nesterenkonia ebinurensis TaxID=2608252 RepID=UPI001CC50A75|nr:glycosyltransferase [Nesterenkonia ebinurensis]